jgi:hypothetical protein
MKFTMKKMTIDLARGATLNVEDPASTTIRVLRGRIWITQEGSVDDVFVDAGGGHTFRGDGRALISADGPTGQAATLVFDAPLAIHAPASFTSTLRRLVTWRHAPASIASNAWEGL